MHISNHAKRRLLERHWSNDENDIQNILSIMNNPRGYKILSNSPYSGEKRLFKYRGHALVAVIKENTIVTIMNKKRPGSGRKG